MKHKVLSLNSIFLYFVAFYSSFRNVNIYLIGNNTYTSLLVDYFYLIMLSIIFFWMIINKIIKNNSSFDFRTKYFVFLLGWVILQSILNVVVFDGYVISINVITSLLTLGVITIGINNKTDFKKTLLSFGIGGGLSALIPLVLYPEMIGTRISQVNNVTFNGGFWNNTLISFVSVSWLLLAAAQKKDTKRVEKVIAYLTFFVTWVAAFSGLSRSFLLLTFTSLLTYLVTTKGFSKNIKVIAVLVVFIPIIIYFMPDVVEQITDRLNFDYSTFSDEERVVIWKTYIKNIPQYLLWGAGANYRRFGPIPYEYGPHSVFLNWFVQYGIIGFIGFTYLIKGVFKEIMSIRKGHSKEFGFLSAWFVSYITLATINETGFEHASFYAAFAIVLSWRKSLEKNMVVDNSLNTPLPVIEKRNEQIK